MEHDDLYKLNDFTSESKKHFQKFVHDGQDDRTVFKIVIGNEASDLDSMVSSLVYSHFLSKSHEQSDQHKRMIFLPVTNIPREDFSLRTESVWLFNDVGIQIENLMFLDEVLDYLRSFPKDSFRLILTDHNIPSRTLDEFGSMVEEIVDHHTDEGRLAHVSKDKRIIELVGSATTLVAEKMLNEPSQVGLQILSNSVKICKIMLGTILLDTANLDPKAKKATEKDIEIVKRITEVGLKGKVENIEEFKKTLYEKLTKERFDQSSLNSYDLLRVDYKQFTMCKSNTIKKEVGISSIKRKITEWIDKDKNILKEFYDFSESRKLDLLLVMTAFLVDESTMIRELIIFNKDKKSFDHLEDYLFNKTDLELVKMKNLNLSELDNPFGDSIHFGFYEQKNSAASRKQLQPFMTQYYQQCE